MAVATDRSETTDRILAAARKPVPEIRELFELLCSDGKWRSGLGLPLGVHSTGERRSAGFAYVSREGTTYGTRGQSREELVTRFNEQQDREAADFRTILQDADDDRFASQAAYWLK